MTDDIIRMAREAGGSINDPSDLLSIANLEHFAELVVAAERKALETAVLKLKSGVAGPRDYIQGRWDAIGEVQDIIRARGEK